MIDAWTLWLLQILDPMKTFLSIIFWVLIAMAAIMFFGGSCRNDISEDKKKLYGRAVTTIILIALPLCIIQILMPSKATAEAIIISGYTSDADLETAHYILNIMEGDAS